MFLEEGSAIIFVQTSDNVQWLLCTNVLCSGDNSILQIILYVVVLRLCSVYLYSIHPCFERVVSLIFIYLRADLCVRVVFPFYIFIHARACCLGCLPLYSIILFSSKYVCQSDLPCSSNDKWFIVVFICWHRQKTYCCFISFSNSLNL